jgi:hypothetical protein
MIKELPRHPKLPKKDLPDKNRQRMLRPDAFEKRINR